MRRLGEPLQTDTELMGRLAAPGVRPGVAVTARRGRELVRVDGPAGEVDLTAADAVHIFVSCAERLSGRPAIFVTRPGDLHDEDMTCVIPCHRSTVPYVV